MISRRIAITIGTTCIILIVGLGGAIAVYTSMINDKNNTISSLTSQISQLNSNVTNLQKQVSSDNSTITSLTSQVTHLEDQITLLQTQVDDLLNATATSASVEEISLNPSVWLNKIVAVEGNLTGPELRSPPRLEIPWNFQLSSNGTTLKVFWSGWGDLPDTPQWTSVKTLVLGNFTKATEYSVQPDGTVITVRVYNVIEAEKVYMP